MYPNSCYQLGNLKIKAKKRERHKPESHSKLMVCDNFREKIVFNHSVLPTLTEHT